MDEIIKLDNDTYHAKKVEMDPRKCAINRSVRIAAINREIFGDGENRGFANWTEFDMTDNPDCICICGHYLEAEAHYVGRRDGPERVCLGAACIKQLDIEHGTNAYERMKRKYKKCPLCACRKNIDEKICKKCEALRCPTCSNGKLALEKNCWFCSIAIRRLNIK
jgi:hypothetical protein